MRPRVLILLLTAGVLVLIAVLFMRPPRQTPANGPAAGSNEIIGAQSGPERKGTTAQRAGESQKQNRTAVPNDWASEPLPPGSNLQERLEELARRKGVPLNVLTQQAIAQWSNAMNGAAQEINLPMDFYGKAVDEKGQPVVEANVQFGCVIFPDKQLTTNAITDTQGMFILTGVTGAVLKVRVTKLGYEEPPGTNQNSFSYYSPSGAGFQPDPNNPVIFKLRKKE